MEKEPQMPADFNAKMAGEMTKGISLEEALKRVFDACQYGGKKIGVIFPPYEYIPQKTISGLMDRGFKVSRVVDHLGLKNTVVEWEAR